ncbi:MAG: hypothetical protein IT289_09870 [Oligoflexia bacterium]|nr:hypothetical protein [Oligoflexia bacterium]
MKLFLTGTLFKGCANDTLPIIAIKKRAIRVVFKVEPSLDSLKCVTGFRNVPITGLGSGSDLGPVQWNLSIDFPMSLLMKYVILTFFVFQILETQVLFAQTPSAGVAGFMGTSSTSDLDDEGQYTRRDRLRPRKKANETYIKRAAAQEEPKAPTTPAVTATPTPIASTQVADQKESDNKSVGEKVEAMVLGAEPESLDQYRNSLDPEDPRRNIIELTVAPMYFYNTSTSPYAYRNYLTASPGALTGLALWLTPFLALDTKYRFTLQDDIREPGSQERFLAAQHVWVDIGLKFRRSFGAELTSPVFTFGVRYVDYNLTLALESTRSRIQSRGAQIDFDAKIPSSKNYAWTVGVSLVPYLSHREISTSSLPKSGTDPQSIGYGARLGGEYLFGRNLQGFFNCSYVLEKHAFGSTATVADPLTGTTPSNTPVVNQFIFLDMGIKWGR